jgi:hypothetical protein
MFKHFGLNDIAIAIGDGKKICIGGTKEKYR